MIVQRYVVDRISFILTKDKSTIRHPPPIAASAASDVLTPLSYFSRSENGRIRTRRPLIVSHNPPFPVRPSRPFLPFTSPSFLRRVVVRVRPSPPSQSAANFFSLADCHREGKWRASEGLCSRHARHTDSGLRPGEDGGDGGRGGSGDAAKLLLSSPTFQPFCFVFGVSLSATLLCGRHGLYLRGTGKGDKTWTIQN